MPSVVALTQDDDIGRAIVDALGRLDLRDLIDGKLVAVKPNDTAASPQDTSGVTQGDTLRAVLVYLKQFEPRRLVVTGGAGAAETADVFEYSGMMEVIRQEGVEFFDHNRPPFVSVALDYGPQAEVMVNPFVSEIETLISLAQLKLHRTATVTLSMKNIAMSFPAADYYGHPRASMRHSHRFFNDMHGFIVGMIKRFPIDLSIIVGHPAMIGTGPLGGKPVETGIVIASRDCLAADVVGARLLGFDAQGVGHLDQAYQEGMGEADIGKMAISGLSLAEIGRLFGLRAYGRPLDLP